LAGCADEGGSLPALARFLAGIPVALCGWIRLREKWENEMGCFFGAPASLVPLSTISVVLTDEPSPVSIGRDIGAAALYTTRTLH